MSFKVEVYDQPLALSNDEIYGCFESNEWRDGILARVMRNICKDESPNQKWTLFDGPVDTLWIESMNTLLDDNKLLTLLSGEAHHDGAAGFDPLRGRGPVPGVPGDGFARGGDLPQHRGPRMVALRHVMARAARVRRGQNPGPDADGYAGEVHGGKPRVQAAAAEGELVDTDRLASVRQFCALFDAHHDAEHGIDPSLYPNLEDEPEAYVAIIELTFLFCLIWSVGATLDDDSRKKFDVFLRENDTRWPHDQTVYEYFVDAKAREWVLWEKQLTTYRPPPEMPFSKSWFRRWTPCAQKRSRSRCRASGGTC